MPGAAASRLLILDVQRHRIQAPEHLLRRHQPVVPHPTNSWVIRSQLGSNGSLRSICPRRWLQFHRSGGRGRYRTSPVSSYSTGILCRKYCGHSSHTKGACSTVAGRLQRAVNLSEGWREEKSGWGPRCIYCGKPATEPDHLPPRCLFPPNHRSGLIAVPSCTRCNRGFSKDDEYFRQALLLRHDISEQPRARPVLDSVFRALQKPSKAGFRQALFQSMFETNIVTPGGLYLGRVGGQNVDAPRIRAMIERITRGLYWEERGTVLPLDFRVAVQSARGWLGVRMLGQKVRLTPNPEITVSKRERGTGRIYQIYGTAVFTSRWTHPSTTPALVCPAPRM